MHRRELAEPPRERLGGVLKNILIASLLLSAVFLADMTGLFGSLLPRFGAGETAPLPPAGTGGLTAAARPLFVVVTNADGERYGAKFDDVAVRAAHDRFGASFGDALSLMSEPVQVSEERWRLVLGGESVLFDYLTPQPLEALSRWLGSGEGGVPGVMTRRICLAGEDGNLTLYYIDGSGNFYSCAVGELVSISQRIGEFSPNGTRFAYEAGEIFAALDPYAIVSVTPPYISGISVSNPLPGEAEILKRFDINELLVNQYTDLGTRVFVENDGTTLRVESRGVVLFATGARTPPSDQPRLPEVIDIANSLVQDSIGVSCGIARVELAHTLKGDVANEYELLFRYVIGGLPVTFPDGGYAARVRVRDGVIVSAMLHYREYRPTGESRALPRENAAAAAAKNEQLLTYIDSGETVDPAWINVFA